MSIIKITPEIMELFLDKLQNRLINGETINHYESHTRITESFDSEGNLINSQKSKSEKRKTTILPTPQCDIDLIAKSMSDDEAIRFLTSRGFLVTNPELVKNNPNKPKGISDSTVEDIKKRLLGIDDKVQEVIVTEVTESIETSEI